MDAGNRRSLVRRFDLNRRLMWEAVLVVALLFVGARAAHPAHAVALDWTQVPVDRHVSILHAAFDKGGYLLKTSTGNTIVVPFTDDNLYAMKFAVDANGKMTFVNAGDAPVLYLPAEGFLSNAAVEGARWFPFTAEFRPEIPVYAGIAPGWAAFVSMPWYVDMACAGSYWSDKRYRPGNMLIAAVDASYTINGHWIAGWEPFRDWAAQHPAKMRIAVVDPGLYRRAEESRRLYAHRR